MSHSLSKGDVIIVKPRNYNECIGLIKYIGPLIDHDMMSQYVGIELLQSINNGHNGTIDNVTYFTCNKGYGFHTKITNVIKKLSSKDLFHKMLNLTALLHKKLKRISKLESLIKIDVNLPVLSPSTNSTDSNYSNSYRSVLSLATPMTNYSINNNQYQNAYNIGKSTKKLALKPYESSFDTTVQNIPLKLSLKASESSFDYYKNALNKDAKIRMIERRPSLESESFSSKSFSPEMPEPKPKKIRNKSKHKHSKKKSNKTKSKPPKKKPHKMGRSKSHQINDEVPNNNKHKIKHRKKSELILTRKRSQTAEQHQMEQILSGRNVDNNYRHVQTRTHGSIYIDNNMYTPQTNPSMSTSKSTPSHIALVTPSQTGGQKRFASITEVLDPNQFYLQQSNTQMIDDLEHEITYNMYNNHTHTPSSGSITPNMLMVNTAYSPYVNHYVDHTPSATPNSTHTPSSLSPYPTHNEYYRNGNNIVKNVKHNSYSTNINRNQMYYVQAHGHEMYQHK